MQLLRSPTLRYLRNSWRSHRMPQQKVQYRSKFSTQVLHHIVSPKYTKRNFTSSFAKIVFAYFSRPVLSAWHDDIPSVICSDVLIADECSVAWYTSNKEFTYRYPPHQRDSQRLQKRPCLQRCLYLQYCRRLLQSYCPLLWYLRQCCSPQPSHYCHSRSHPLWVRSLTRVARSRPKFNFKYLSCMFQV